VLAAVEEAHHIVDQQNMAILVERTNAKVVGAKINVVSVLIVLKQLGQSTALKMVAVVSTHTVDCFVKINIISVMQSWLTATSL